MLGSFPLGLQTGGRAMRRLYYECFSPVDQRRKSVQHSEQNAAFHARRESDLASPDNILPRSDERHCSHNKNLRISDLPLRERRSRVAPSCRAGSGCLVPRSTLRDGDTHLDRREGRSGAPTRSRRAFIAPTQKRPSVFPKASGLFWPLTFEADREP